MNLAYDGSACQLTSIGEDTATGSELRLPSARSHCTVDGQLATQTAVNHVEALLGPLTSRCGAYTERGSARLHKAEGCCRCRDGSWSLICTSPAESCMAKVSGVHDATQLPIIRQAGRHAHCPIIVSVCMYELPFAASFLPGGGIAVCRLLQLVRESCSKLGPRVVLLKTTP